MYVSCHTAVCSLSMNGPVISANSCRLPRHMASCHAAKVCHVKQGIAVFVTVTVTLCDCVRMCMLLWLRPVVSPLVSKVYVSGLFGVFWAALADSSFTTLHVMLCATAHSIAQISVCKEWSMRGASVTVFDKIHVSSALPAWV